MTRDIAVQRWAVIAPMIDDFKMGLEEIASGFSEATGWAPILAQTGTRNYWFLMPGSWSEFDPTDIGLEPAD